MDCLRSPTTTSFPRATGRAPGRPEPAGALPSPSSTSHPKSSSWGRLVSWNSSIKRTPSRSFPIRRTARFPASRSRVSRVRSSKSSAKARDLSARYRRRASAARSASSRESRAERTWASASSSASSASRAARISSPVRPPRVRGRAGRRGRICAHAWANSPGGAAATAEAPAARYSSIPESALIAVGLGARRRRAARSSDSRSSSAAANARRASPSAATALPAWSAGVASTTSATSRPLSPRAASIEDSSSARPRPNRPAPRNPSSAQSLRAASRKGPVPSSASSAAARQASARSWRASTSSRTANSGSRPAAAACLRRIWLHRPWMVPTWAAPRSRRTRRHSSGGGAPDAASSGSMRATSSGGHSASASTRSRMRPFSSAAAFSVKVTAHRRAAGSGSALPAPPSRCRHSVTRLCVLPVPAPACTTALSESANRGRRSDTRHPVRRRGRAGRRAAVLFRVGRQRDDAAGRFQLAEVAAQRLHREQALAHLADAGPDLVGEVQRRAGKAAKLGAPGRVHLEQRPEVDDLGSGVAQGGGSLRVAEADVRGVDVARGLPLAQQGRVQGELELRREQPRRLQLARQRLAAARLVVDDEQRSAVVAVDAVDGAADEGDLRARGIGDAQRLPGVRIPEPALELRGTSALRALGLDDVLERPQQLAAAELPESAPPDVLLGGERLHLLRRDLGERLQLGRIPAQRQPRLLVEPAEERIQAAVEEGAALASRQVVLPGFLPLDAEELVRQGAKPAGGVLLELVRRERRVGAEANLSFDRLERRPGQLPGEAAGFDLSHESAQPLPLRRGRASDSRQALPERRARDRPGQRPRLLPRERGRHAPGRIRERLQRGPSEQIGGGSASVQARDGREGRGAGAVLLGSEAQGAHRLVHERRPQRLAAPRVGPRPEQPCAALRGAEAELEEEGFLRLSRRQEDRFSFGRRHPEYAPPGGPVHRAPVVVREQRVDGRSRGKLAVDEAHHQDVIEPPRRQLAQLGELHRASARAAGRQRGP